MLLRSNLCETKHKMREVLITALLIPQIDSPYCLDFEDLVLLGNNIEGFKDGLQQGKDL